MTDTDGSTRNPHSTVTAGGHPIHPMLVPFPIVCFIGAFVTDIFFAYGAGPGWAVASNWLLGFGLGMAALTAIVGASGRMRALGVVVFPLAALALGGYQAYGHVPPEPLGWRLQLHAWTALLAYATLAIAALLALMLWLQERGLRRREFHRWLRALPPLVELETLLFRTIGVGFVLLTATLLTGALFVENMFAQHLAHKTVLSVLSWLAFGGLLLGRWRYGWRGAVAVRWTLAAMALLVLAFFGSKFVLELVLHRTS